jgi:hypothetical protein
MKRIFSVKAVDNCDILTLNKADLARVEGEFEEIVAEMFMHAHKKIRKILKIKEEKEFEYVK